MNEGFTITCNKCGKSTVITQKKRPKYYPEMKYSNSNIKFIATNMEETFLTCKCGNEVKEE
ncbi:hypothetical protein CLSAB_19160 [Clostridium saccharobutylicum]|uniref:hypothetical protein n=1 Tax=Clostridium saccharobutylicum TaxID=169679 RepID=UPI00098C68BA|nr:hypothetical protein [Clostridium saccharobutylicum]OOM17196.1 hypothetical protein CLSAB_19160 [Clostridium saccharobutylicum]